MPNIAATTNSTPIVLLRSLSSYHAEKVKLYKYIMLKFLQQEVYMYQNKITYFILFLLLSLALPIIQANTTYTSPVYIQYTTLSSSIATNLTSLPNSGLVAQLTNSGGSSNISNSNPLLVQITGYRIGHSGPTTITVTFTSANQNQTLLGAIYTNVTDVRLSLGSNNNYTPPTPSLALSIYESSNVSTTTTKNYLLGELTFKNATSPITTFPVTINDSPSGNFISNVWTTTIELSEPNGTVETLIFYQGDSGKHTVYVLSGTKLTGLCALVQNGYPSGVSNSTGWSGPYSSQWSSSVTKCVNSSVTITGPTTETATFKITIPNYSNSTSSYNLTESSTLGGSTGPLNFGSALYKYGTSVTLSETPSSGYTFIGWTGSGTGSYTGTNPSPTITIDGKIYEVANFQGTPSNYVFTASANPSNGGTVSPTKGVFSTGLQITLSENPSSGYYFTGWIGTGAGSYTGINPSPTITMNSSISETANFQNLQSPIQEYLTESSSPSGAGSLSPCSGICNYTKGSSITISETPHSGYRFTGWSCYTIGGTGCYSGNSSTATIIINASQVNETAHYLGTQNATVTVTQNPAPCSINIVNGKASSSIYQGAISSTLVLAEVPTNTTNCVFTGWTGSGGGSYTGSNSSVRLILNDDIIEVANYKFTAPQSLTTTTFIQSGLPKGTPFGALLIGNGYYEFNATYSPNATVTFQTPAGSYHYIVSNSTSFATAFSKPLSNGTITAGTTKNIVLGSSSSSTPTINTTKPSTINSQNSSIRVYTAPQTALLALNGKITIGTEVYGGTAPYAYKWYEEIPSGPSYLQITCNSQTCTPPLSFSQQGAYHFKVTVTDSSGNSSSSNPTVIFVVGPSAQAQKPIILNISNQNTSISIAGGIKASINLSQEGTSVQINTQQGAKESTLKVNSILNTTPPPPKGYSKLLTMQINLTQNSSSVNSGQPSFINVTTKFNCNIPSNRVAPFILENNIWVKIANYTVNATACTLRYRIPADPQVGIFETNATNSTSSNSTSTIPSNANTTTAVQHTQNQSITSQTPSGSSTGSNSNTIYYYVAGVIAIIVIILVLLASKKKGSDTNISTTPPTSPPTNSY